MQSSTLSVDRAHQHHPMPVRALTLVHTARPTHQNLLLDALPSEVFERIAPHLELVELLRGAVLCETGSQIRYTYFPINSIVSLFYTLENGDSAQTAMVGSEGMVGISPLMGCQTSPSCAVMLTGGSLVKVRSSLLTSEFEHNAKATQLLLRYTQSLFIQLAQAAVCNRHHSVEDQLCRWLLMALDRQQGNEMFMTHELIANLIGARREGVTEAAGNLQRSGIIHYRRGHITIVDRPELERHVCECYKAVKNQTDHLIPGCAN